MSWTCGDCGTKWPEAVASCTRCLSAEVEQLREALERASLAVSSVGGRNCKRAQEIITEALHPALADDEKKR